MELSEKQKTDLKKYSKLLNALNMEDGIRWFIRYNDDYWEDLEGPYYYNRAVDDEVNFVPRSIEEFMEELKENFDTDLFYNEHDDSKYGGLEFIINAEKQMIIVKYYYYVINEEESMIEKSFLELSQTTNPWRRGESSLLKLTNQDFLEKMKEEYGPWLSINYSGSGDDGWLNEEGNTKEGNVRFHNDIEEIAYEAIEMFYSGWENNEGSSGHMTFEFEDEEFKIYHTMNIQDEVTDYYKSFSFA